MVNNGHCNLEYLIHRIICQASAFLEWMSNSEFLVKSYKNGRCIKIGVINVTYDTFEFNNFKIPLVQFSTKMIQLSLTD